MAASAMLLVAVQSCNNSGTKKEKTTSDILEQSISSVFTVKVTSERNSKTAFGFAGEDSLPKGIAEIAYAQSLNIEGAKGVGSGFVIRLDEKIYLITNTHVIEKATDISKDIIAISYSRNEYSLRFIGADSFYDIAVFEILGQLDSSIVPLTFSQNNPRIGQKVFAIGNPFGNYPYTVTEGIISALNRPGLTAKAGYLQSSAPIASGNSGGPLINEKGELVGVNTAGVDENNHLNFALESKILEKILPDLISKGRVERTYLGLEICQDFTYKINEKGEIKIIKLDEKPRINAVLPNSPAAFLMSNAKNRYINQVNGEVVNSVADLLILFEKAKPNDKFLFELLDENGISEKVEINASTLTEQTLNEIAKFYFDYHYNINLSDNENGIILNFPSGFQPLTFQYYDGYSEKFRSFKSQGGKGYIVSCGNMFSKDDYEFWQVKSYKDLGNAIRLAALNGTISFVGHDGQSSFVIRVLLKTKENVMGKTLIY